MTEFPTNPFEDIKPNEFNKLNKKHVTEDFVEENLKLFGWTVYTPFNDTGIDRIAIKTVCPNKHTPLEVSLNNLNCPDCGAKPIVIRRFIQIKTRSLKNNVFGFTLKSKDIRTDPRHCFLLYSDQTEENKQDFLIILVGDFVNFFLSNANKIANPFGPMAFRKGNNKLNSLRYNPNSKEFTWSRLSWELYRNKNGLKKIQDPIIELNYDDTVRVTRENANKLLKNFSPGRSYSEFLAETISGELNIVVTKGIKERNFLKSMRTRTSNELAKGIDKETSQSRDKYFEHVKSMDALGDDDA